ncbi:MAG: glutaredoxin family protein [Desulfosarcinaceae bacterium]|nr:glutaredoxin family protein [Desulfosarcinaceae bacterium]
MNELNDPSEVRLYSLTTCSHCKALRRYLDVRQVTYRVTYVDMLCGEERNRVLRRLKQLNPAGTFPTMVVGETVVVGFKEAKISSALSGFKMDGDR